MMYREQAESLFLEIAGCAEKAISRYNKPDIIVDFPAKVVTIDDNYDSDTEEERLFRIYSGEWTIWCKRPNGKHCHYATIQRNESFQLWTLACTG